MKNVELFAAMNFTSMFCEWCHIEKVPDIPAIAFLQIAIEHDWNNVAQQRSKFLKSEEAPEGYPIVDFFFYERD